MASGDVVFDANFNLVENTVEVGEYKYSYSDSEYIRLMSERKLKLQATSVVAPSGETGVTSDLELVLSKVMSSGVNLASGPFTYPAQPKPPLITVAGKTYRVQITEV